MERYSSRLMRLCQRFGFYIKVGFDILQVAQCIHRILSNKSKISNVIGLWVAVIHHLCLVSSLFKSRRKRPKGCASVAGECAHATFVFGAMADEEC